MSIARVFVALLICGFALPGCDSRMQPAQAALNSAQAAVDAASADASKYMPEHYQRLQAQLTATRAAFDRKEYEAVLNSAPALTSDANALASEAAQRRATALTAQSGPTK